MLCSKCGGDVELTTEEEGHKPCVPAPGQDDDPPKCNRLPVICLSLSYVHSDP